MKIQLRYFGVMLCASALMIGCSQESRKARLAEKADDYFSSGNYDAAKIEYMNLLELEPKSAHAMSRIGQIWYEQGAPNRAFPFLAEALKFAPDDTDARIKLVHTLRGIGRVPEAKIELERILEQDQAHPEANLLSAHLSSTDEEAQAIKERLRSLNQNSASIHLALATLARRKGDMSLVEKEIEEAFHCDPNSPSVYLARGLLSASSRNHAKAAEDFKKAMDLSEPRSETLLKYPRFKIQTDDLPEAKRVLQEITRKTPDYLTAWAMLARVAIEERSYDQALSSLENIFSRDPDNLPARLIEAEVRTAKGEKENVLESLKQLQELYPNNLLVEYRLARAYVINGMTTQAYAVLARLTSLNPDYSDAVLLKAQLDLRNGNPVPVVEALKYLLEKRPGLVQAQLQLAEAYRMQGRLEEAATVVRGRMEADPESSKAHSFLGMILRQQNKFPGAREAFEKAQSLAPQDPLPVFQLAGIELAEGNDEAALRRMLEQSERIPDAPAIHYMLGKIYSARKEWKNAEAAILKAIDLEPNLVSAYDLLVFVYSETGQLAEAGSKLEEFLESNPDHVRTMMKIAVIFQQLGDWGKVKDIYERTIQISPDFAPALNNLAWIYAEKGNELEKALDLAQRARDLLPDTPSIAHTLGWIVYQQKDYPRALALIREAAAKKPESGLYQYHLGMASYKMGQTGEARAAFEQAVASEAEFDSREDAKKQLSLIVELTDDSNNLTAAELEALLQARPGDPILLMHLASAREKQGELVRAAELYEQALKENSNLVPARIKLAKLCSDSLNAPSKAMEHARAAYNERSVHATEVAGLLGRLEFDAGNVSRAYLLLQESARDANADTEDVYAFGTASYALGKIAEAKTIMQQIAGAAGESKSRSSHTGEAMTFLTLLKALEEKAEGAELKSTEPVARKLLEDDPDHLPAQMILAGASAEKGETKNAEALYLAILERYSAFAPALRELALLYAADPAKADQAYKAAISARNVLPDDLLLVQTLAELSFEKKEFEYAKRLLQEIASKGSLDARGLYYLGKSYLELKETEKGKKALENATSAGLPQSLADDATATLSGIEN